MASFAERMTGAAKLDVHVYEEVEADTGATGQAMGVVLLASVAGGIGSVGLGAGGFGGVIVGGIAALLGWVTWAFLIYIIGTRLLALVAMVIAVRQALDYTSTFRAVGVCLVGWVISGVLSFLILGFAGS